MVKKKKKGSETKTGSILQPTLKHMSKGRSVAITSKDWVYMERKVLQSVN